MTNRIKMFLPLFFLVLIACNSPEKSGGGAQDIVTTAEKTKPMPEKLGESLEVKTTAETANEAEKTSTEQLPEKGETKEKAVAQKVRSVQKKEQTKMPKNHEKTTETPKIKESETPTPTKPKAVQETAPATSTVLQEETTKVVEETKQTPPKEIVENVNHKAWDALLRANVSSSGKVNYGGFKSSESALNAYLESLKNNAPESSWSSQEKLAFWINAYNAFTVKLIVENSPISSITKLHNGKPWDVKWIEIGGKSYSLNNIENDIIRPTFKEARIHFAVNCAAQSCPPLLNRAWTADNLNSNFNKQTKAFVNNSKYNVISASEVQVSKIFDWYGVDFGDLIGFLNKYSDTKIDANAKVSYKEYDWALNN